MRDKRGVTGVKYGRVGREMSLRPRVADAPPSVGRRFFLGMEINACTEPEPSTAPTGPTSASLPVPTVKELARAAMSVKDYFVGDMRGMWTTRTVYDVFLDIKVVTSLQGPNGNRVFKLRGAVLFGFLAEEGKATPAIYVQNRIIGEHYYFKDDYSLDFENNIHKYLRMMEPSHIRRAARIFRTALVEKFPELDIDTDNIPNDEAKGFGLKVFQIPRD